MRHIIINKKLSEQNFNIPKIQPNNYEILAKRIEEKKNKGEKVAPISLVLPNNLKKISEHFSLSSNDIAKELGLKTNFILDVMNQNANFSGKSIIKFIKKFNIPFNLLYNINSNVTYMEEYTALYGCIIKADVNEKLSKVDLIELVFSNQKEEYDYIPTLIKKINSDHTIDMNKEDNKLHYKFHLDLINNLINDTIDNDGNDYYLVAYYKTKKQKVTKFINLQENIDLELINYLNSEPFFNYVIKNVKISKDNYMDYKDSYKLSESYNFLLDNQVINSDVISKDLCIIEDDHIIIPVCQIKKVLLNKLKLLRQYKKLSTYEMADILCISNDTYISIEKGHQKLSPYIMWKLEKEFGVLLQNVINIDEYYKFCCEN